MPSAGSMAFAYVDTIMLAVHRAEPPSDAEWADYCAETYRIRNEARGGVIYTLGGGPNSRQREQVRRAFDGAPPPPMAVMTGSHVVRGIITSLNWFLRNQLAAFNLNDLDGALRHVARDGAGIRRELIVSGLEFLAARLGVELVRQREASDRHPSP